MIEFYSELYNYLETKNIKFDVDGQMIRFTDSDYTLYLVLESENNSVDSFTKNRDSERVKHAKFLVFIWFDLWTHKKEIILSKITHLCGLSKKIHARKTKVVKVDKVESELFLSQNHLNKPVVGYKCLGLYLDNELIALAAFAKRRKFRDDTYSAELMQFTTKNYIHINGGLSKLIQHFRLNHPIDNLMTYIDLDWSNGNKFNRIGFIIKETKSPIYFNHKELKIRTSCKTESKIFNLGSLKAIQNFT